MSKEKKEKLKTSKVVICSYFHQQPLAIRTFTTYHPVMTTTTFCKKGKSFKKTKQGIIAKL